MAYAMGYVLAPLRGSRPEHKISPCAPNGLYSSNPNGGLDSFCAELRSAWTGADARPYIVDAGYQCANCGQWNATTVDESAGSAQTYVEDRQIRCKPNVLQVSYDRESRQL
jgi:cysteine-rich CPXCG protein